MSSRRLDISSLLCDDQPHAVPTEPEIVPEPVVLAPHLRNPRMQQPRSQMFGLDALVQAASEEQKRISTTSWQSPVVTPHSLPMILNPMPEAFRRPTQDPVKIELTETRPLFHSASPVDKEQLEITTSQPVEDDVDMAVTELVAETIESRGGSVPPDEISMEVDVENELLSLIDDKPARVPSSKSSRQPSMPPPASVDTKKKPPPKSKPPKAPAKPRAKPPPKPKTRTSSGTKTKPPTPSVKKTAPVPSSRSRSTSAMPGGSVGPESARADEEEEVIEDNKLYCVCQTKYDEDRFMIACDRCDEWYHTPCVEMPDLEVDLVDQFVCPLCIEKYANLNLKTTYQLRCLYGLEHPDPASQEACHKPARGVFSKYCSDECGVKNLRRRIERFTRQGGKRDMLWEAVKNAEKREGTVLQQDENSELVQVKPAKSKVEREVDRLNSLLDNVVKLREELKKGMEMIVWREKLLELAVDRAENMGHCGWDQRLCFGDEEWGEFGEQVLESYGENDEETMAVDSDGDWWCQGQKQCDRHAGWQNIRRKDIDREKELKEHALSKLTTKEREIRKRIEDMVASKSSKKVPNGSLKKHNAGKKRKTSS